MKRNLVIAALFGMGSAFPLTSMAQDAAAPESAHSYSANVGLFSQYIWRGMTQTKKQPALQGGVDYAHASGFYAGAWVSNVGWLKDGGSASLYKSGGTVELDLYGGYGGEFGETGIGYDLGVIQYIFPGSKRSGNPSANATELYAGLSYAGCPPSIRTQSRVMPGASTMLGAPATTKSTRTSRSAKAASSSTCTSAASNMTVRLAVSTTMNTIMKTGRLV